MRRCLGRNQNKPCCLLWKMVIIQNLMILIHWIKMAFISVSLSFWLSAMGIGFEETQHCVCCHEHVISLCCTKARSPWVFEVDLWLLDEDAALWHLFQDPWAWLQQLQEHQMRLVFCSWWCQGEPSHQHSGTTWKPVQLVHCVDANPMHDALTGGSVPAHLYFINLTHNLSKKQSTVATATCSS